nr:hypothetical protein [Tanacetum cinerariifolium]
MIFDGMLRNLDNVSGKFLMYLRFIQTFLDKQLDGLPTHKEKYDVSFHTKKVSANMKRIDEGIEDVGEEEVVEIITTAKMLIDTIVDVAQATTAIADIPVSATETIVTTAPTITAESTKKNVKVTQAPKRKGVMIQDPEETTTTNNFFTTTSGSGQRTELVEESIKKDEAEIGQESSSKREGDELEQERSKKQKVEDDKESGELNKCLEIIPDDGDDVTIDATPLSFNKMLKNFNREDLEVLWRLVKDRFEKVQPVDHMNNFFMHTLKTMFEHHVENNVWKNQQGLSKMKN